jgi:catechol 2,3-dioxygenase-like lactoylglutathione lyase family enzyme
VSLHHVEIWVPDLEAARRSWGWLLPKLGYDKGNTWPAGFTWRHGETYLVFEESAALTAHSYDRCRPGLNHLAFWLPTRADVDALARTGPAHGWELLFGAEHPHAGGPDHYAAYLADPQGFEVELVAQRAA